MTNEEATKLPPLQHVEETIKADLELKDTLTTQAIEIDPKAEKKLRFGRRRCCCEILIALEDRSNLGNARVAGMYDDLKLDDQDYYHAVVTFQVGYLIAGTPSNMILVRVRPSLYIPMLMILWGTCATCLGAIQTKGQLWAVRFLLGITEAGFAPGVFFLISAWYRKEEQSKRFIIFLSASILSGAFGGIIAGIIAKNLDGAQGIAGWRWLFIIEGVLTVAIAFIAPFFLLNFPATSNRLTLEEKDTRAASKLSHWRAFLSAVLNWRLYFLAVPYMQLVGSSALAYFYPYLIQGLGYTAIDAQFMTAPLYVVALAISIPLSILADKYSTARSLFVSAIMLTGGIFCGLAMGIQTYVPCYVFLCFINSAIWAGSPIALSYASSSLGPVDTETRAISLGIINGLSQLAQVYGSALFPSADAPAYYKGFGTYTGLCVLGATVSGIGHFLLQKYPYRADFE
ncbi:uncharacterized protein Z518_00292 [Rhinocladiella mackenziei CBS 650.93]|uniref:Major facilitator superfamily (MFS) profile domain-containing protein n=1 Tax=Rhinocladiella mackenziei CBS 650.93 TaxID=1442369 RepID=A0A0D2HEW2_9EURO|nr:uncharacterized protein Z518_00292 [Rhinocladiella mackenziei CBS 650.93]KIX09213.1 hypothetical protein Z518_00292 [Rhinocladiella mackenziei CBS 650.93]